MAYNFEATFTQPLLTKLDNGVIKGAKDWANAITNAYITTIKAGLPQGTPPTLPAPGLNPTTPPPYPIGASPFTTANAQSKIMYNVIYAYFYAKELKLEKGAIKGLMATIKQLIAKVRNRTKQVKQLIDKIKLITEALKQLPKLITEVLSGIKDEIKAQIRDVKDVFNSLDDFRTKLDPDAFNAVFRDELALLNSIKNFNPTDFKAISKLSVFISQYDRLSKMSGRTDESSVMKQYLMGKLFSVAKIFIGLADGITDPSRIINLVKDLSNKYERTKRLLEHVAYFDYLVRYFQPKLVSLKRKKDDLVKEIRERIQTKIVDLRKKLDDKILQYTQGVKTSKAISIFKKAKKTVTAFRKDVEKKIREVRKKLALLRKAYKLSLAIAGKVLSIKDTLKKEFDSIKQEILADQKKLRSLLTQANTPQVGLQAPQGPGVAIDFGELSVQQIKLEIDKLTAYFSQLGLGSFGSLGALIITQTKCDMQTFIRFFERKNIRIPKYAAEISLLEMQVRDLINTLQELRDGRTRVAQRPSTIGDWLSSRVKSVKDVLSALIKRLDPKIKKIQGWIKSKISEYKTLVETKLIKFKEQLITYAISLVPVKSDVQDKKDKKAFIESKIKKIKEKLEQIKKILKLSSYVAKMVKGSLKLTSNIAGGLYKFVSNEHPIDDILNGYYSFKMEDQPNGTRQQLMKEKQMVKDQTKSLLVIEALTFALLETFKDIKNSEFIKDLTRTIDKLKSSNPTANTLIMLKGILENPPRTPKDIKAAAERLGSGALMDAGVITVLVNLERKYLRKSRVLIETVLTIKQLEGTKFEKTLINIQQALKKNQSFIMLGFTFLKKEFMKFASFIRKKVTEFIDYIKKFLKAKLAKVRLRVEKELDKIKEKLVNLEAPIMTFTFALAGRSFWTGATWQGPTGTTHITYNVGPFKPIKAKTTDGASAMIREIAKGFETQLNGLQGTLIPPPNTAIAPIPFVGYK
jgi:hypothetical protein